MFTLQSENGVVGKEMGKTETEDRKEQEGMISPPTGNKNYDLSASVETKRAKLLF